MIHKKEDSGKDAHFDAHPLDVIQQCWMNLSMILLGYVQQRERPLS